MHKASQLIYRALHSAVKGVLRHAAASGRPQPGAAPHPPTGVSAQVTPAAGQCAEFGDRSGFLSLVERTPPGVMPGFAGQLSHQNPVGTRSGMILTHLSRVEYDYVKGKVNSRNEVHIIRRVPTARPTSSGGAWFMTCLACPR